MILVRLFYLLLISIICLFFPCCSQNKKSDIVYGGHFKIGTKYKIKEKWYEPKDYIEYKEEGYASWYGKEFHGKKTANGDLFDKRKMTAAHRTLPLPSIVIVKNLQNNKQIKVVVNDRGPFSGDKIIDLSEEAAKAIGIKTSGGGKVVVEYLPEETSKLIKSLGLLSQRNKILALRAKKLTPNYHIKIINVKSKKDATKIISLIKSKGIVTSYKDKNNHVKYQVKLGPITKYENARDMIKKIKKKNSGINAMVETLRS